MEKGYIVLTPEKIEDMFKDLQYLINLEIPFISNEYEKRVQLAVKTALNYKKQELLKSIKQ